MTNERPPLGDIKPGDKIIIFRRLVRGGEEIQAEVTKVGRVWITAVKSSGYGAEYRFRKDDQTDGSKEGYRTVFRTPEQHAWVQRALAAEEFLKEAGIRVNKFEQEGRYVDNKVTLANIIRRHEGLPEL